MTITEEVISFARDYINGNQTTERKQKIAACYYSLFRERPHVGCGTCYIEAIFKIIKFMEKKPCSFRLKPGALLQAFGDETKTCTNANLTDELAEYHIRTNPGCIKKFSVPTEEQIREMFFKPAPELEIVPAQKTTEVDESVEQVKETAKRGRKPKEK